MVRDRCTMDLITMENMRNNTVKDTLVSASVDVLEQCYAHPFVQGIKDGSLTQERFRHYMIQDCLYLRDFAKVFALAAAKTKRMETAEVMSRYMNVMNGEMNVHDGYLGKLGITPDEINAGKQAMANLSYTSYMLRIAYEQGPAEILAATLPCAYSYEWLAKKMIEERPDCVNHSFYGDWITEYASKRYHTDNIELFDLLEKEAEGYGPKQMENLCEIYRNASVYELMFWDMAYNRDF